MPSVLTDRSTYTILEQFDEGSSGNSFSELCEAMCEAWTSRALDKLKDWSKGKLTKTEVKQLKEDVELTANICQVQHAVGRE